MPPGFRSRRGGYKSHQPTEQELSDRRREEERKAAQRRQVEEQGVLAKLQEIFPHGAGGSGLVVTKGSGRYKSRAERKRAQAGKKNEPENVLKSPDEKNWR